MTSAQLLQEIREIEDKGARVQRVAETLRSDEVLVALASEPGERLDAFTMELGQVVSGQMATTLRTILRKKQKAADRAAQEENKRAARLRVADEAEDLPGLGAAVGRTDLPDGIDIPGSYRVRDGEIVLLHVNDKGETEVVPVAPRPIFVSGVLRDLDSSAEWLHLEWLREGAGWHSEIVRASLTQDPRAFIATRDHGAPVAYHNIRRVCEWLAAQQESSELPTAHATARLGWQGKGGTLGFMWGRQLIRGGIDVPPDVAPGGWPDGWVRLQAEDGASQLADGYHAAGTWAGWLQAIEPVGKYPIAMLGIYAGLSACLLGVIPHAPNAIIDWSGDTSHGKTTLLRIAGSCWGQPDERAPGAVVHSWSATDAGSEGAATMLQHLPLILDDTKRASTAKGGADRIAATLYQVANGKGKLRGRPDGLRKTPSFRVVCLSTGEAAATSFTEDAGARARCLCIRGLPFGAEKQEEMIERIRLGVANNYGHAGPRLVRWLCENRDKWPAIREHYDKRVAHWAGQTTSTVGARLAGILGLIEVAGLLAHRHLGIPKPECDPAQEALKWAIDAAGDADRPRAALRSLYDWATQHGADFIGRHMADKQGVPEQPVRGWAGAWSKEEDWKEIGFVPDCLRRVLAYHGHEPDAVINVWKERGWIEGPKDGHWGKKKRIPELYTSMRFVMFSRTLFETEGGI